MARDTDEKPTVEKCSYLDVAGGGEGQVVPSRSRKLRILCLHGFRTSGKIMAKQLAIANWAPFMDDLAEVVFMDAPCAARGKAGVEKQFEGPYFEWLQSSPDFTELYGLEKATKHFSDFVSAHGPFDGLLGFSQGAVLAAAWRGLYEAGDSIRPNMSSINFLVIVGGGKDLSNNFRNAYTDTIHCPSLHLIGEKCFMKPYGEQLLSVFKDPVLIRHPFGHVIPRLGAAEGQILRDFLLKQLRLLIASSNGNYPRPARSLL